MEQTSVQKLARVLRVLVMITFVCNIIALLLVPAEVGFYSVHSALGEIADNVVQSMVKGGFSDEGIIGNVLSGFLFLLMVFVGAYVDVGVWLDASTAVLTLFLWACGICTAVILWQGRRVLDTILKGTPFVMDNAKSMRRAAVCCFVISGAALVRVIWGIAFYQSIAPMFTYNALFVPIFLMGGLLFMVMSALFRQAAEIKAENDLTI